MQLPSLRQPAGASVLAGVLGAGVVDALLTARVAARPARSCCWRSGCTARRRWWPGAAPRWSWPGFAARGRPAGARSRTTRSATARSLPGSWPGASRWLVIALVVAAGQRLFVGNMSSQKLATIAAGGLVAVGALPAAIVAITALPVLRRLAALLPRPRGLGATGFLLLALAAGGALALVAALSRADWRVLDLGPLYALALAIVLGGAHALFWYGLPAGRALRARLPAAAGLGAARRDRGGGADRAGRGRAPARGRARVRRRGRWLAGAALPARRRRAAPPTATATGSRRASAAATATTARADVYPGAEDVPGDGIDENCEGGDAKARRPRPTAGGGGERDAPRRRRPPRSRRAPDAFKGNLLIVTIDALRADRLGVAGYSRPAGQVADADAGRAWRAGARTSSRGVVAGAQHAALVPVDPDRPLPVGHRVGQAGRELPEPAAVEPDVLRDARGRRAGCRSGSSRTSTSPPTAASARASRNGRTTARAPSRNRTRTSRRRASSRASSNG